MRCPQLPKKVWEPSTMDLVLFKQSGLDFLRYAQGGSSSAKPKSLNLAKSPTAKWCIFYLRRETRR
jgi:hypothetical protein